MNIWYLFTFQHPLSRFIAKYITADPAKDHEKLLEIKYRHQVQRQIMWVFLAPNGSSSVLVQKFHKMISWNSSDLISANSFYHVNEIFFVLLIKNNEILSTQVLPYKYKTPHFQLPRPCSGWCLKIFIFGCVGSHHFKSFIIIINMWFCWAHD